MRNFDEEIKQQKLLGSIPINDKTLVVLSKKHSIPKKVKAIKKL